MKKLKFYIPFITLFILVNFLTGCADQEVDKEHEDKVTKRVGMVIKLKPEFVEEYKNLHSDTNAGVRDLLQEANIHNFSIFLIRMDDGDYYEFGYYEYTGNDFDKDMAHLTKKQRNIEWLKICDPMQIPLKGYDGWAEMEQIYYNK